MSSSPITVVAPSKAWTVFARSDAGMVGSNPTQRMDVCILCVYSVLPSVLVEALQRADHPSKESYRQCIGSKTEKAANTQQRVVEPY
jgi:hypothetical protein